LKRYFDLNYNGEPYDAVGKRKGQDLFYILGGNKVGGTAGTGTKIAGGATSSGIAKNLGTKGASSVPKSSAMGGSKPAAAAGGKGKIGGGSGDDSE